MVVFNRVKQYSIEFIRLKFLYRKFLTHSKFSKVIPVLFITTTVVLLLLLIFSSIAIQFLLNPAVLGSSLNLLSPYIFIFLPFSPSSSCQHLFSEAEFRLINKYTKQTNFVLFSLCKQLAILTFFKLHS